jgi:multisubunit Na+/H+ antiporter MnhF subunit
VDQNKEGESIDQSNQRCVCVCVVLCPHLCCVCVCVVLCPHSCCVCVCFVLCYVCAYAVLLCVSVRTNERFTFDHIMLSKIISQLSQN